MANTKLTIGFSPCPNDCFIFDALIHNKIDTEGIDFEMIMGDVETLNKKAFKTDLDITKLSFHAYTYLTETYQLLNAGSALGEGCGPLLISKNNIKITKETKVAIPGKYTSANFLLSIAHPQIENKIEMVFSEIENAVLNGDVDAGLIIHENRFTYAAKGLKKIIDLGEFWETQSGLPIPLGGIVINRNLPEEIKNKVNRVLRNSVEYAFQNPDESNTFVKQHAQEMDEAVMKQHIKLYVNDYSIDLGDAGKKAVEFMFDKAIEIGVINNKSENIFVK